MSTGVSKTIYQLTPLNSIGEFDKTRVGFPVQYEEGNFVVYMSDLVAGLDKYSMGLGNVDNTADKDKPVSDATNLALSGKADRQHKHSVNDLEDWDFFTQDFYRRGSPISISLIEGLDLVLGGKANVGHSHAIDDVLGLSEQLLGKAAIQHEHTLETLIGFQEFNQQIANSIGAKVNRLDFDQAVSSINDRITALENLPYVQEIEGTW